MSKFKVGEIAIIVNPRHGIISCRSFDEYNGSECIVIDKEPKLDYDYVVDIDGRLFNVYESELRKKYDGNEKTTGE